MAAFAVALVTGLRIATETPDRTWINWFDAVLPRDSVWVAHMQAAVVLVAVAIGYVVYMLRSGLGRRVQLDKVRLRGLFGRGQARLSAVIALMYWIFFVTMSGLLVSGGAALFRFLLRLRRGDAALGGDLGDPRLCRPACPDPVQERRRCATAAHLSSRPAACAAAAARCRRTAGPAGRAVGALAGIRKSRTRRPRSRPIRCSRAPRCAAIERASRIRRRAPGRPRAIAKPDPAGQCVRGRGRRRHHRRLAHRGHGSAGGG